VVVQGVDKCAAPVALPDQIAGVRKKRALCCVRGGRCATGPVDCCAICATVNSAEPAKRVAQSRRANYPARGAAGIGIRCCVSVLSGAECLAPFSILIAGEPIGSSPTGRRISMIFWGGFGAGRHQRPRRYRAAVYPALCVPAVPAIGGMRQQRAISAVKTTAEVGHIHLFSVCPRG